MLYEKKIECIDLNYLFVYSGPVLNNKNKVVCYGSEFRC